MISRKVVNLTQVDTKDIYDKGTLGTDICTYLVRNKLPRYQWTFLEGKSRLRFLGWSNNLKSNNRVSVFNFSNEMDKKFWDKTRDILARVLGAKVWRR